MSTDLLFDILESKGGQRIAVATLNRPRTLNGLTLEMSRQLEHLLGEWEADETVSLVVLRGEGEKAFCAGGDLHSLHASMQESPEGDAWANEYARSFFAVEYRLDHHIHRYTKPIVCWGNGIVMGGGVGLMMGASHRIVTETTRFAMPEITIGIFPDVAGSWMLGRLPAGIGVFLALTGAQLGEADCRYLGLADYCLSSQAWETLLQGLQNTRWAHTRSQNDVLLDRLLRSMALNSTSPAGPLQTHYTQIAERCDGPDFVSVCAAIAEWKNAFDPWLARAAHTFLTGAPGSARLGFTLQKKAKGLSLEQVFQMEYTAVLQCMAQPDFKEGIRALLIDKDKSPHWKPASIEQANEAWVQRFFEPVWPANTPHPLSDLGS